MALAREPSPKMAPAPAAPPVQAGESASRPRQIDPTALAQQVLSGRGGLDLKAFDRKRQADIAFVLDCTSSMRGEHEAIKSTIADFAETISLEGVRARIGLVEYRDHFPPMDEELVVHRFLDGDAFTGSSILFREKIDPIRASGGGPEPESALDALMAALDMPFREDAAKVLVLITDAPPHIPDRDTQTMDQVLDGISALGLNQMYLVTRLSDQRCHIYLRLIERCRGLAFELGQGDQFAQRAEDFKKTLLNLGKTISSATR
jgi:Mg-chelatase subunit ChlD